MGLLTDPNKRHQFTKIISKYNNIICTACYLIGIFWFVALAYEQLNASTYFSENALLPGVVEGYFYKGEEVRRYSEELKEELRIDKRKVPKKWVYDKFREIGLDVYTQNFSVHYPLNLLPQGQTLEGQNVYAILRAPRAASTEAVVISAPFRPFSNPQTKTHVGIALMISLAKYFYKQPYWAKDVVFVVADQEYVGMKAWLDAYHGWTNTQYITADDLLGRSGSIQAAINLELGNTAVSHININIEGLNGQLPNLDMVNLVTRLCKLEGLRPMLHRRSDHRQLDTWSGYRHSLITMVTMMWHQATGSPTGNHGLFHQYNIEAVTLEGVKKVGSSGDVNDVGRIVEGCLRSLNNLLERFHQSFFFYLLPSTHRYVSIGLYMPPFGIMTAALLIKAIAMWIASYKVVDESSRSDTAGEASRSNTAGEASQSDTAGEASRNDMAGEDRDTTTKDTGRADTDLDEDDDGCDTGQSTVTQLLPLFIISITLGTVLYFSPSWFAAAAPQFKLGIDDALTFGLLAVFIASLSLSSVLGKLSEDGTVVHWEVLKSVSLILFSLVLFSISLINISLAVFIAVTNIPAAILVRPTKQRLLRWLQMLLLILTSPPALLFFASLIQTLGDPKSPTDVYTVSSTALFTAKRAVFLAVLDERLIGKWTYALFCLAVTPAWLFMWAICRVIPSHTD